MELISKDRARLNHGDTFELDGLTFLFEVNYDEGMGEPWKEHDGHGPVSTWTKRDKRAGERVLSQDRTSKLYYDFAEACKIAMRDRWGFEGSENLTGATKHEIAAIAAERDYKYLRKWCNTEWHWVYVLVTLLDVNGKKTDKHESLGAMESTDFTGTSEAGYELAEEIASQLEGVTHLQTQIRRDI